MRNRSRLDNSFEEKFSNLIHSYKSCEQEGNISITSGNTQSLTSQTVADDTPFLLYTDSDGSGRE